MKFLTWDVAIVAIFALLLAYSILIRRHKALATLVSVYISYFVASSWGAQVAQLFTGNKVIFNQVWIKADATPYVVQSVLLILFTFLISAFLKLGGKRSRYNMVEIVVYALCTVAIGALFILLFLPDPVRANVFLHSKIPQYIFDYRNWILIAPVIIIIYFGIYTSEEL